MNPYQPRPQQLVRKVGAPIGLIIFAGVLAALLMLLAGLTDPLLFVIGFIPSAVFIGLAALCYFWLDRWEPEPPRLLLFGFLWGGGFATVFALLIGMLLGVLGILSGPLTGAAVQAPLVEEFGKGMFLVVMLTGLRRREMTTLVDCLVYAGMVGLGFAFIEDLLYLSGAETVEGTLFTAALRLILGVFAHPLFTTMTALGIWFSLRQRSTAMKLLCIVAGYLAAAALHGIWNAAATLGGLVGYLGVYALVMVPVFAGMVTLAIRSRRREGRVLQAQLGPMVQQGLIIAAEADWISALPSRRARGKLVAAASGPAAVKQVARFTDAVTELAFVRDRLVMGQGSPRFAQDERDLVQRVFYERSEAIPALAAAAQPGVTR